jgi:hypothetical protein
MTKMLLHAEKLEFEFPERTPVEIKAEKSAEFTRALEWLGSFEKN